MRPARLVRAGAAPTVSKSSEVPMPSLARISELLHNQREDFSMPRGNGLHSQRDVMKLRASYIAMAFVSVAVTGHLAHAQGTPAGSFHSRAVALEMTPAGQAHFTNSFGPLITSSFVVAGDTIT